MKSIECYTQAQQDAFENPRLRNFPREGGLLAPPAPMSEVERFLRDGHYKAHVRYAHEERRECIIDGSLPDVLVAIHELKQHGWDARRHGQASIFDFPGKHKETPPWKIRRTKG